MKIDVLGKNGFTPNEKQKEYVSKKLEKLEGILQDYDNVAARVVFKKYKTYYKVEVTIPSKNIQLRAEVTNPDAIAACDGVVDKLVTQVKRWNDRVKDKLGKTGLKHVEEPSLDERQIVRDKHIKLEPMTKEEAIDQMELLGHDFFVFLDRETRKTNVVYLRDDGNYAVIETEN